MKVLRGLLIALVALALVAGVAMWVLTAPARLDAATIAQLPAGDAARGERIFNAGGCASCHAGAEATGDAQLQLGGGQKLATPFGTFVVPNISPHPQDGIGGWNVGDLANAMLRGVSPGGAHYYPAFPYASYARMDPADIADLFAYLQTLPQVAGGQPDHDLAFPYNIRRGLGVWKLANLSPEPVLSLPDASEQVRLGQYLVEGPGHCGECHTPRDFMGGTDKTRWLAGAAAAEGEGNIPNITPGEGGIGDWSQEDIAYYLESGFTPDFDSVGGVMVKVQQNMAKLRPEDRAAIAAYLKAVPGHSNGYPAAQ